MNNPIKILSKRELVIWICSLIIVFASNIMTPEFDIVTLLAAIVGVTSLIFAAKGNVIAQIPMIVFSILYGIISFRFRYWGEMITYLGMSMPMAVWSTITWLKNPSEGNSNEVKIQTLTGKHVIALIISGAVVTAFFYCKLEKERITAVICKLILIKNGICTLFNCADAVVLLCG